MLMEHIVCPISFVKINSTVSRLTAFFSSLTIALYLATGEPFFIAVLAVDFFVRAFGNPNYSLVRWFAFRTAKGLRLPGKKIDQAPKLFASRLGFLCTATAAALVPFQLPTASVAVAGMLLVFTSLDAVVNFCVGCAIYHYIVFPFYQE